MDTNQHKVALVTGSDSGIGQASAIELARDGFDVIINYLHDSDGAEHTRREVEALGREAVVVQADVGVEDDVERMFDTAIEALGQVDVLMNAAGVDASGTPVAEMDIAAFEASMRTNLSGPVLCSKHYLRRRQDSRPGRILNVTSVHEEIPRAGAADYDCAKGAVRNLTRTLALELAEQGVTVNSIAPGMVLTPFNQEAVDDPKVREEQVQSIPMKRAAEPREVGRLAAFLASDDASYITGASYVIDGGLMQNQGQGA